MKTISELRLEGDARVSIHDMNRFEAAILGSRGDLDAWLECNNEEEVRLHIGKLLHLCVADLQHENQSLRTKIEAMGQQVPVCVTTKAHLAAMENGAVRSIVGRDPAFAAIAANENDVSLYALPGAQTAPSINEGVRKVTLDFRWESEAQHHIPTIEIEFEPVSPESPNDSKSWQDRDRLAAMLTPEAKP